MSVNSILNQAPTSTTTTSNQVASDKEMFLKLLVAQLTYQDPLNPAEDTEFIAQLAQFTQVEELQNIGTSMDTVVTLQEKNQLISGVNLLGTTVVASGSTILKSKIDVPTYDDNGDAIVDADGNAVTETISAASSAYYRPQADVTSCTVSILDSNNAVVHTEDLGIKKVGQTYTYSWNGMNSYGAEVNDGYYQIAFTAKDAGGNSILVDSEISGKVYSVENIDGVYWLHLTDNRQVKFSEVGVVGVQTR